MKIRVSEATPIQLDLLAATCEVRRKAEPSNFLNGVLATPAFLKQYRPSTTWAQGGPIIEREYIQVCPFQMTEWRAQMEFADDPAAQYGPTPLIAAMRCWVASELGDEVDVPEELR